MGRGCTQRRRENVARNKQYGKARRTKRKTRDIDQIVLEDMIPENMQKLLNQPIDEEKPGAGQHYCVTCSRYFVSQSAQETHFTTKQHKKRFKVCQDVPYTIEESERAGGLFNPKKSESKLAKLMAENESKMDE